jgi:DNA (cytosine-5)-methyltransferase 1
MYVFAGGFTQGVKDYFNVVAHLEDGNYGVDTAQLNHPEVSIYTDPDRWPTLSGIKFMYANPPCAPWSSAGSKVKYHRKFEGGIDPNDPRVECWQKTMRMIALTQPTIAAVESVTRCWTKGREFVESVAKGLRLCGYACTVVLHDGYDCGVPQHRKRAFFVFHKVGFNPRRPQPGARPRTVREAFKRLGEDPDPTIRGTWGVEQECLEQAKEGDKLKDVYMKIYGESRYDPARKKYAGRPGFLRRRLWWDKPSGAMTGGAVLYHPSEHRFITIGESAALCGYPRDYEFLGTADKRYRQIAQAVMPPVGSWIAFEARRAIEYHIKRLPDEIQVIDFIKG